MMNCRTFAENQMIYVPNASFEKYGSRADAERACSGRGDSGIINIDEILLVLHCTYTLFLTLLSGVNYCLLL